jgi:hypothetical protein
MSDTEGQLTGEVISQRHASAIALLLALEHTATSAEHATTGPSTDHYAAAAKDLAEAFARIYGW